MKLITVSLQSARVVSFIPKDFVLELAVTFYDGKQRTAKLRLVDIEHEKTAAEILSRIRKYEQSINRIQESDAETILDAIVQIRIANHAAAYEKLYNFLQRVQEKIHILKSGKSDGYISTMLSLQGMKMEFEE